MSADNGHQRKQNSSLDRTGSCAGGDTEANGLLVEEATARVRKVASMSAWGNRLALCGVIEHLATGIAYYTIKGMMSFAELSGGAQTELVAVGITEQPATAVEGGVVVLVAIDNDSTLFSCYDSANLSVTRTAHTLWI